MPPIRAATKLAKTGFLAIGLLCGPTLNAADSPAGRALDLRSEQEGYLRHYVRTLNPQGVGEPLVVGASIPFEVELHALPNAIAIEVPAGRTLRVVNGPAGIAIVDPFDRKVVQILPPG